MLTLPLFFPPFPQEFSTIRKYEEGEDARTYITKRFSLFVAVILSDSALSLSKIQEIETDLSAWTRDADEYIDLMVQTKKERERKRHVYPYLDRFCRTNL